MATIHAGRFYDSHPGDGIAGRTLFNDHEGRKTPLTSPPPRADSRPMKKLIALAVFSVVGYFAWGHFAADSPAVKTYRAFARAWAYEDLESARDFTLEGSPARELVDTRLDLKKRGAIPGATYSINALAHSILSETTTDGGRTTRLEARQMIRVSGMGGESAFGRPGTDEHVVTLKLDGATWKVAEFSEKQL